MLTTEDFNKVFEEGRFKSPALSFYIALFDSQISSQLQYGLITFLRGISCLAMKNNIMIEKSNLTKIDPRIAFIYFSPSGSGKGIGNSFYTSIFGKEGLGLNIVNISSPTKEKLIGSFDTNGYNNEKNKKKKDKESLLNPLDFVIHGELETSDDLIIDECEPFFQDKTGDKLRMLRFVIDTYGTPGNYLRSETLKNIINYGYYCKCNFALLSYPIEGIKEVIVNNGIFQRVVSFHYKLSKSELKNIMKQKIGDREKNDSIRENIFKELKEVKAFIEQQNGMVMTITKEATNYLEEQLDILLEKGYQEDEEVAKLVQSFFPRLTDTTYKMACAFALSKKRKLIHLDDMEDAWYIASIGFDSMKSEIIERGVMADRQKKYYDDLKKCLGMKVRKSGDIVMIMTSYWGLSATGTRNRLKKLIHFFDDVRGIDKVSNERYRKLK